MASVWLLLWLMRVRTSVTSLGGRETLVKELNDIYDGTYTDKWAYWQTAWIQIVPLQYRCWHQQLIIWSALELSLWIWLGTRALVGCWEFAAYLILFWEITESAPLSRNFFWPFEMATTDHPPTSLFPNDATTDDPPILAIPNSLPSGFTECFTTLVQHEWVSTSSVFPTSWTFSCYLRIHLRFLLQKIRIKYIRRIFSQRVFHWCTCVCGFFFLFGKRTYQSKNSTVSDIRKCPPKTLGNSHGGVSWFNRFFTTKNCTCSLMKQTKLVSSEGSLALPLCLRFNERTNPAPSIWNWRRRAATICGLSAGGPSRPSRGGEYHFMDT